MYDQHVTREQQGKTLAHLSAVSDAPQTDSDAGAARSVSDNGIESRTRTEGTTVTDSITVTDSTATLPVDAGAAYLVRTAQDAGSLANGDMDDDADLDAGVDADVEVTMREVEKPLLVSIPGFDQMFEEIEDQWQERALCAQTDPEAFFPEKGGSTREAKRICLGCDVKDECLEYALANDERFGIWGGLSERERRRLKRGIV